MCNKACIDFAEKALTDIDIENAIILEVGSFNVNGSYRQLCEEMNYRLYLGVDIQGGPGVDMICKVEDLVDKFGTDIFDLVICTEVLEHVEDWREAIRNLKKVVLAYGSIILTTRSQGFPEHGYPNDYWRFSVEDMKKIFSDFMIEYLEEDKQEPGVFIKARKQIHGKEPNLDDIKIFSIKNNCYE